jgi:CHAT domain-containing protein/tetratricopeptide (TPR) repeat protein
MNVEQLADELLRTPETEWPMWFVTHAGALSPALIAALKRRSDRLIKSETVLAERITRAALTVADQLPGDSVARALALWARGNWAAYRQPEEAVRCYREALAVYEGSADSEAIARISSNLIFVYSTLGRFEEALTFAEQARQLLQHDNELTVQYRVIFLMNYGLLLYELGRYQEALTVNAEASALAQQHGMHEEWAELQVNQAFTLAATGQLNECEPLLLTARTTLEQFPSKPSLTIARIDLNLGDYYSITGNLAEALRCFRRARNGFVAQDVTMDKASVLLYEADLLRRLGALRAARNAYRQAYQMFVNEKLEQYAAQALLAGAAVRRALNPADPELSTILTQAYRIFSELNLPVWRNETVLEQARLALISGDYAQAESLLTREWDADAPLPLTIRHLLLWGHLCLAQGDNSTARTAFTTALERSRESAEIWLQRDALVALGNALAVEHPEQAMDYLAEAAQIDDLMRADLSVAELTAEFQARRNDALPRLAQLELQTERICEALQTVWRWRGGALIDLIQRHGSQAQIDPKLENLQEQIAKLRWELERSKRDDQRAYKVETLRDQLHKLEEQVYHERRYLLNQRNRSPSSNVYHWQTVHARLDADCLIEYVCFGDELYAFCVTRDGNCTVTSLGLASDISELLQRLELKNVSFLRLSREQQQQRGQVFTRDVQVLLKRLYQALIAPLLGLPSEGKLLIAPCPPFHLAPFAALWDGSNYLIERYTIEQIPTGSLLAIPAPTGPSGPALAIGASAGGVLQAVEKEIKAIADILPDCQVYIDDPAALDALHQQTPPPRIVHLSAHTVFDDEPTIFAGLHLADRIFTIEECYRLNLTGTDLVTLNGCTTAYGMESGGALIAFQSAFLIAGARRLLVSLWPINDELAAEFMTRFYRILAGEPEVTAALRQTQQELLREPEWSHPAIWSAFGLIRR